MHFPTSVRTLREASDVIALWTPQEPVLEELRAVLEGPATEGQSTVWIDTALRRRVLECAMDIAYPNNRKARRLFPVLAAVIVMGLMVSENSLPIYVVAVIGGILISWFRSLGHLQRAAEFAQKAKRKSSS